ncbi:hypothetical protein ACFXQA_05590 [Microbacterium sp. P07]|uniref:hypothetical protein n=1 Tax=Microbacterium sp. P07 TaxID=3366952 RepID=UPI0037466F6F
MTIELRGELDPVPIKRISTSAPVEPALTNKLHRVSIDGFEIMLALADATSMSFSVEGAAVAGLITVATEASDRAGIDRAARAMMTAAMRFSDAIRSAKPNVGLVGQPPEFVSFAVRERGGEWGSYNHWPPASPWYVYETIKAADVEDALQQDLGLVDRLLAQATYWAAHAAGSDPSTALLLAAIASESHAKRTFHSVLEARGEGALGELLLTNVLSSRAFELYGPIAQAVVGRHLKTDHPLLYKGVGRLFELRNKVAHTGALDADTTRETAAADALSAVRSARGATRWLTGVVSTAAAAAEL